MTWEGSNMGVLLMGSVVAENPQILLIYRRIRLMAKGIPGQYLPVPGLCPGAGLTQPFFRASLAPVVKKQRFENDD